MDFPARFSDLPEYAFPRLRTLLSAVEPGGEVINMTIGEPRHAMPPFLDAVLSAHTSEFGRYPPNEGAPELLEAMAAWVGRRFGTPIDPTTQVLSLNGTREGLFNAMIALCEETKQGQRPVVLIPNPFYQVYAVAAMAVGAEPVFVNATEETGFLPDFAGLPAEILNRVTVAYLCSPSNPQGAVADDAYWRELIALAERYDFKIFSDECYSEIYREAPPVGGLSMAAAVAAHPERVSIFHSLSKRSNLPGLRSGFVAGGPESIRRMKQLRAYSGAPLPLPLQRVAEAAWRDETHVEASLEIYREKYRIADEILGSVPGYRGPAAGFFLWLPVPDGEAATVRLFSETGVRVLPGAYLGRETATGNPGAGYIRVAMVAPLEDVRTGLTRLRDCLYG